MIERAVLALAAFLVHEAEDVFERGEPVHHELVGGSANSDLVLAEHRVDPQVQQVPTLATSLERRETRNPIWVVLIDSTRLLRYGNLPPRTSGAAACALSERTEAVGAAAIPSRLFGAVTVR